MQVKREKPSFSPIVIVLETEEEVRDLKLIAFHSLSVPEVIRQRHDDDDDNNPTYIGFNKKGMVAFLSQLYKSLSNL